MDENKEVIQLTTNHKSFYLEYLSLKKPVFEVMLSMVNKRKVKLHPKLLHVFALFLYYNYKYRDIEEQLKWKMIFDYDTKVAIMNEVGINEGHLNTYISILRNIRLLVNKTINQHFIFYPDTDFELIFKFTFEDEKQQDTADNQ
jgi:hypothetical protein